MSTHRPATDGRTLKPTLASNRTPRTPLAPRVAVAPTSSPGGAVRRPLSVRQDALTGSLGARATPPRQDETPVKDLGNVTPRSSTRKTRVEGSGTPVDSAQSPSLINGRTSVTSDRGGEKASGLGSVRATRPKSLISGAGRARSPLTTSPGFIDLGAQAVGSIDSRFFHASEARSQEPAPRKVEVKKASSFFYADGQHEGTNGVKATRKSPPSSVVSEARLSGPRARTDPTSGPLHSPPILSPALSTVSSSSPFFATLPRHSAAARSPSPSKENIHLSYRKGASQIFGSRPSPLPSPQTLEGVQRPAAPRTVSSEQTPHRKSPSLSSLDSPASHEPRRRSATTLDPQANTPSPLSLQTQPQTTDTPMSPTKALPDLASDARRERKLLDLEISNSSLLAINASLEREVRRQKTELKRFRRLSRAGRFDDRTARLSEGLSAVGEADEDAEPADYDADFGLPSGFTDLYDGSSHSEDDETSSIFSASDAGSTMSPSRRLGSARDQARLAKDEERLRKDLERHKELLVQSQMMNQSLKRCTFAAEDMLREGRKALDYHVKTSDVKLGGRVLADGHEDDTLHSPNSIGDAEPGAQDDDGDDTLLPADDAVEEQTLGFLDVWAGVGGDIGRRSLESSDFGDRDSGIEVDKPPLLPSNAAVVAGLDSLLGADLARPPEISRGRPGIRWGNTIS